MLSVCLCVCVCARRHHLFPTMPRHSFSRVRREVMEFCARHGLPYESCTIWESTYKVYQQLASVAKAA